MAVLHEMEYYVDMLT